MKAILDFLKESGTFYVATVDGDKAQVRPFGAVCEFEGKIYLITANQKDVYKQMKANPNIAISSAVNDKWLRLSAVAEEDTRREARVAMLEANPSLGRMYNADDNVMVVFKLTGKACICSFTVAPEEHTI